MILLNILIFCFILLIYMFCVLLVGCIYDNIKAPTNIITIFIMLCPVINILYSLYYWIKHTKMKFNIITIINETFDALK